MNKKIFAFFLLVVLIIGSSMSVFADNEEPNDLQNNTIPDIEEIDTTSPAQVVVDITQLLNPIDTDKDQLPDTVEVIDPQLVSVEVSNLRISANDTTGFKSVMLTILGDYEPTVTDYTYQQNNYQYLSHSINIERDWSWICSCGVFALLIYCTFRSIGGILARF